MGLFPLDLLALKSSPGVARSVDISNARGRRSGEISADREKVRRRMFLLGAEGDRTNDQSFLMQGEERERYKGDIGRGTFIDRRCKGMQDPPVEEEA